MAYNQDTSDTIYTFERDFLPEPHKVRNALFDLPLEICTRGNYPGRRCVIPKDKFNDVDEMVFALLKKQGLDPCEMNYQKYFTIGTVHDHYKTLMHVDVARYHVLIYLSPYQDDYIILGQQKSPEAVSFKLDDYNVIDKVHMQFNTCVLLDTRLYHAPEKGCFGTDKETGRCIMMYSFGKNVKFEEVEKPYYHGNIVAQYNVDIPSKCDKQNLHTLLKYVAPVVEKHCFPYYHEFYNTIEKSTILTNTNYCKLFTETFETYGQSENWVDIKLNMNQENGPSWIMLFIRVAAQKGGVCKVVDISNNKVHTFLPLENKCIIFPAAWPWRYRFMPVEEGLQIVDVIKINSTP